VGSTATTSDVRDLWGSNNGTIVGIPQLKGENDCVSGKCIYFNGSSYVDTGYKGIETINNALTIETWFNSETYTVYNDVWHDNHIVTFLNSSGNGLPDGPNMMHIGFYQKPLGQDIAHY
jgi:hypothetical protein